MKRFPHVLCCITSHWMQFSFSTFRSYFGYLTGRPFMEVYLLSPLALSPFLYKPWWGWRPAAVCKMSVTAPNMWFMPVLLLQWPGFRLQVEDVCFKCNALISTWLCLQTSASEIDRFSLLYVRENILKTCHFYIWFHSPHILGEILVKPVSIFKRVTQPQRCNSAVDA